MNRNVIIVGGAVALLGVLWAKGKLAAVVPYINPADGRNAVNQGVEVFGEYLTGNQNWTLGGQIYDWTHDPAPVPTVPIQAPGPFGPIASGIGGWLASKTKEWWE